MSAEITATHAAFPNTLLQEHEVKNVESGSAARVAKRKLDETNSEAPPEPKRRTITSLIPTDSSVSWTNVKMSWWESKGLKLMLRPALAQFTKPKVSEDSWKIIDAMDLSKVTSYGELEKLVLTVIDQVEKSSQEKKEQVHEKLKICLQTYAEASRIQAIFLFKDLMKEP